MTQIDSRCGLHCTGCFWRESQGCLGCIETEGHPFHGECPIAHCCQDMGQMHCGQCANIPCDKLYAYSYADPVHGDHPAGARVTQCRQWAAKQGIQAWCNVLLTSAGFEDEEGRQHAAIAGRFVKMLPCSPADARVLFVTAAAIDDDARTMALLCRQELLNLGILPGHICDCALDEPVPLGFAMSHDVLYFTGGDTAHLLHRVRETGFDQVAKAMVVTNKIYVGVSAGSLIATPNIASLDNAQTAGLALVHAVLTVHEPANTPAKTGLPLPHVPLANHQALAVSWQGYELIEN